MNSIAFEFGSVVLVKSTGNRANSRSNCLFFSCISCHDLSALLQNKTFVTPELSFSDNFLGGHLPET